MARVTSMSPLGPSRVGITSYDRLVVLRISRRLSVTALTVIAVFVVTALVAGGGALRYTGVSPVDELVHFDYAYKVYEGHILPTDPYNSSFTLTQQACRGVMPIFPDAPRPDPAACKSGVPAERVSHSYVLMYAPLYYWTLAIGMHILHPIGVPLYTAARLTSTFLYALSACLFVFALIRLGVSRRLAAGAVIAVTSVPGVEFWGSTITPDCCAMLFGALGIILLTRDISPRRRAILGALVGLAAGLVTDNLAPVGGVVAAACYLLPNGFHKDSTGKFVHFPRNWRSITVLGATFLAPLVIPLAWSAFRYWEIPVLGHAVSAGARQTSLTLQSSLSYSANIFLQTLGYNYFVGKQTGAVIATALNEMIFGGSILIALARTRLSGPVARLLAVGCLAAFAVDVFYVVLPFYVHNGTDVTTVRYGVELIPLGVAPVAIAIDHGWVRWAGLVGGSLICLYFVVTARPIFL